MTAAVGGEEALIAGFLPALPRGAHTVEGPGDDCAVVRGADVVTTDMLVESSHFWLDVSSPYEIGARAAAQNLADVAAMGAVPTSLVCALSLPPGLEAGWVNEFARGLGERCEKAGAGVVGGDITSGPVLTVSITALGSLEGRAPVLRSGARAGHAVAVSGTLGLSAAGLEVAALLRGLPRPERARVEDELRRAATGSPAAAAAHCLGIFKAPTPNLSAGVAAAQAGASAMMDVSDGLLRDVGRIARASGVAIDLDQRVWGATPGDQGVPGKPAQPTGPELPDAGSQPSGGAPPTGNGLPGVATLLRRCAQWLGVPAGQVEARVRQWMLTGGEDHALLATFPTPQVAAAAGFQVIGSCAQAGAPEVTVLGQAVGNVVQKTGWDHLQR
ncbi:thiamine-phosphate kinase [Buchananella felis]|uniref:thiamine-phosphate kinase n=1 Tax=Buchananella felis TaxID=3231492 RepID=UPI0035295F06